MAGLFPFAAGVAPNFERGNLKKFLKLSIARRLWPGVGLPGVSTRSQTNLKGRKCCFWRLSDFLTYRTGTIYRST